MTTDIPLLAFFRPQHLGASVPMYCSPQHCRLAAARHTCTCPRRKSTLGSGIPRTILSWAEARVRIARVTLTVKLDGNRSSFQLTNSALHKTNCDSHIDASHSGQLLVKGERLVGWEVNAVMPLVLKAACLWSCIFACVRSHSLCLKLP